MNRICRRNHAYIGFTLIELCAVIAIISTLASIAVLIYRHVARERYDAEAIAVMNNLYEQAFSAVSDWGIRTSGSTAGIEPGCTSIGPTGAGIRGAAASAWTIGKAPIRVAPPGAHHWQYQICVGLDSNGSEAIVVDAHRCLDDDDACNMERVIVGGTGFDAPIVAWDGSASKAGASTAFDLPFTFGADVSWKLFIITP